jgi:hypothetical protein
MIRAKVELLAKAVTRYSNEPDSLIVPANTESPGIFRPGGFRP